MINLTTSKFEGTCIDVPSRPLRASDAKTYRLNVMAVRDPITGAWRHLLTPESTVFFKFRGTLYDLAHEKHWNRLVVGDL